MDSLKINETPVRTSKSFNINNIKINEDIFPKEYEKFDNVEVIVASSKDKLENAKTSVDLKYGLGEKLIKEIQEKSNQNYQLTINSITNKDIFFNFSFDEKNTQLIENIDITAIEGTTSNIIIKYEAKKEIEGYHNGVIKLLAQKNANVNIIIVNLLSDKSNNFLAIQSKIEDINIKEVQDYWEIEDKDIISSFKTLVVVDLDEFVQKWGNKSIRKNLTIPQWLNTKAEALNINFSQVLQEALMKKISKEQ